MNNIAVCYEKKSDYREAVKYYEEAERLKMACSDLRGLMMSQGSLGLIYGIQGRFTESINKEMEVLKTNSEMGDARGIAITYYNLGYIHLYRADFVKAIEYFKKSIGKKLEYGSENIGVEYPLLSYCYCKTKLWHDASNCLEKIIKEKIDDKTYGVSLITAAFLFDNINYKNEYFSFNSSEEYFREAIKKTKTNNYKRGLFISLFEYASYLNRLGNKQVVAKEKMKEAKQLSITNNMTAFANWIEHY